MTLRTPYLTPEYLPIMHVNLDCPKCGGPRHASVALETNSSTCLQCGNNRKLTVPDVARIYDVLENTQDALWRTLEAVQS